MLRTLNPWATHGRRHARIDDSGHEKVRPALQPAPRRKHRHRMCHAAARRRAASRQANRRRPRFGWRGPDTGGTRRARRPRDVHGAGRHRLAGVADASTTTTAIVGTAPSSSTASADGSSRSKRGPIASRPGAPGSKRRSRRGKTCSSSWPKAHRWRERLRAALARRRRGLHCCSPQRCSRTGATRRSRNASSARSTTICSRSCRSMRVPTT